METPLDGFDKKLRIIGFRRAIKKAIKKETREESEYAVTVAATTSNHSGVLPRSSALLIIYIRTDNRWVARGAWPLTPHPSLVIMFDSNSKAIRGQTPSSKGESFFFSCTRHVSMYLHHGIVILSFFLSHGVLFFISVLGHYPRFAHPCYKNVLSR